MMVYRTVRVSPVIVITYVECGTLIDPPKRRTVVPMSTETQSRASLDTPSGGLVSQFDLHLRIIADRYLNFFLERSAALACYLILAYMIVYKAKD